jgi:threonine aldolase
MRGSMRFFSDNAAPVCPAVMAAMADANQIDTAYDGDRLSAQLDEAFSAVFGVPVVALWMSTGTAVNALALSLLCPPYGGILAHEEAHVVTDECGAVEAASGGARLITCNGHGAKLDLATLVARVDAIRADVHQIQPHCVTITNATEYGLAWRAGEVAAIADLCRDRGWRLHMDGARLANALAFTGEAPAAVTAHAGVDALSFGFTKNGAMNAEALILFDPALADAARRRRKRAGHLLSKGRYIAAQMLAMLKGDLWLANARAANAAAQMLAQAAGSRLLHPVEANELFVTLDPAEAAALRRQGFDFYDWGSGAARLVTSWHHASADVAPLAAAIRAL